MDVMFLDRKTLLHMIATATRFSASTLLDSLTDFCGQSVEDRWLAFVQT